MKTAPVPAAAQNDSMDGSASTATGHLGLNVTEGLMHVLVRDDSGGFRVARTF